MTAQSIVCGSCAAEVPYGRLSCPSCGELLASVAGSRRNATALATRAAFPDVLYEPPAAPSAGVVDGQLTLDRPPRDVGPAHDSAPGRDMGPARDLDAELPWGDETTTDGAGDTFAASFGGQAEAPHSNGAGSLMAPWMPGTGMSGSPTPKYMPRPNARQRAAVPPPGEAMPPDAYESLAPDPAPTLDAPVSVAPPPFPQASRAEAHVAPADDWAPVRADPMRVADEAPATIGPVASFAGPGAYVPPLRMPVMPAGPPAPAREYAGFAGDEDQREAVSRSGGRASIVLEGDARERVLDFAKWLSVAGSAFAAVGFLLPWGLVVIGSNDVSYFGRWGIAGPWHIVVALAVLGNLGLALLENRVSVWLRTGVAGLGLGALLLGLVWPYITLPALGTGPGAIIAGIGAAALVVSGLLALVTERHQADRPV
jgi:hypothetical protein